MQMIVVSTERIEGKQIAQTLGIVKGNTIRARHLGRDIIASLRGIVGGEIKDYTVMLADARDEALKRMVDEAQKLGADAVINVRFSTSMVMRSAAEILAYGTAVKVK